MTRNHRRFHGLRFLPASGMKPGMKGIATARKRPERGRAAWPLMSLPEALLLLRAQSEGQPPHGLHTLLLDPGPPEELLGVGRLALRSVGEPRQREGSARTRGRSVMAASTPRSSTRTPWAATSSSARPRWRTRRVGWRVRSTWLGTSRRASEPRIAFASRTPSWPASPGSSRTRSALRPRRS